MTCGFLASNAAESAQSVHAAYSSALPGSKSRATGARLGNVRPRGWLDHEPEMEPTMNKLKVLSTAAVMALALPLAMASDSFAQSHGGRGGMVARGGAPAAGMSGGGYRGGGGVGMTAGPRFSGGGGMSAGPRVSSGGGMSAGPRFSSGAGSNFSGRVATTSPSYSGTTYQGGNTWSGGYGRHYRRGGGFWPGVAVGAAVGGSYAYYGGPGYYDQGYYDDSYGYYDDSAVAVVPGEGGDPAWCAQTYRSYDPASGTYLGYDGQRHPCP
jgi:hypothetical protein